jgi:hypothetical protein
VVLNYTASSEERKKHRALVIKDPYAATDSGVYACDVQTWTSNDRKSAELLVISESEFINYSNVILIELSISDPEDSLTLTYNVLDGDIISVKCSATNIYPKPQLTL